MDLDVQRALSKVVVISDIWSFNPETVGMAAQGSLAIYSIMAMLKIRTCSVFLESLCILVPMGVSTQKLCNLIPTEYLSHFPSSFYKLSFLFFFSLGRGWHIIFPSAGLNS